MLVCSTFHRFMVFLVVLRSFAKNVSGYNINVFSPLIVHDPRTAKSESLPSYFGFSLSIYSSPELNEVWLFVGAPKGNRSSRHAGLNAVNSGALLGCRIQGLDKVEEGLANVVHSCREIFAESLSEIYPDSRYGNEFRGAWIGASIALSDREGTPTVWSCGHRWKNKVNLKYEDLYMNGACFWKSVDDVIQDWVRPLKESSPWRENLPLLDIHFQVIKEGRTGYFSHYYSLGESGIAVHVKKKSHEILIGAPGVLDWTGTVITSFEAPVPGNNQKRYANFVAFDNVVPRPPKQLKKNSYLGYSVSSGVLWDQRELVVAGAPRAEYTGKVLILSDSTRWPDPSSGLTPQMKVEWIIPGQEIGSYFGSSLAVVDVTADGMDEIFVGAPFYSEGGLYYEKGGVWVYAPSEHRKGVFLDKILFGSKTGGRFGSAIGSIGDLDRDGFQDIAVGSPAEGEHRGAIYIFRGGSQGIIPTWSQKITGEELSPVLRWFGSSFSAGNDLDNNGYPDFAVGCFGSDASVILFSKRVIHIKTNLETYPTSLTLSGQCFRVFLCISYMGHQLPDTMELETKLLFDSTDRVGRPKAYFKETHSSHVSGVIKAKLDTTICQEYPACLHKRILDASEPLEVKSTVSSSLISTDPNSRSCFQCFAVTPFSTLSSKVSLVAIPGCGEDGECRPLLTLRTGLEGLNGTYILGSGVLKTFWAELEVRNEWAYQAWISVTFPLGFLVRSLDFGCSFSHQDELGAKTTIMCVWNSPIKPGTEARVEIEVEENRSQAMYSDVIPSVVSVVTSSGAVGASQLTDELQIPLQVDVALVAFGVFTPELVIVDEETEAEESKFQLNLQVVNKGVTFIAGVELDICIPLEMKGRKAIEDFPLIAIDGVALSSSGTFCDFQENISEASRDTETAASTPQETRRTLSCSDPGIKRGLVTCTLFQLGSQEVFISLRGNNCLIKEYLSQYSTIVLESSVEILPPSFLLADEFNVDIGPAFLKVDLTITTENLFLKGVEPAPWWIYCLSVLGSILILLLIVAILHKLHFFRRKLPPTREHSQPTEASAENLVAEDSGD